MKITKAEFVTSAVAPEHYPIHELPEVALAGRSNVGKSSFINKICQRKALARTSSKPGKTQTLNFFDVNGRVYFVDLPGYGYAQVPRSLQETWGQAVTRYLAEREQLRLVVHLLDARHTPTSQDDDLLALLEEAEVPAILVATKSDKLGKSEKDTALAEIRSRLSLEDDALIIPFSSLTKEGLGPLWRVIDDCAVPYRRPDAGADAAQSVS